MRTTTLPFHVHTATDDFTGTLRVLPVPPNGKLHATWRDWHEAFARLRGPVREIEISGRNYRIEQGAGAYGINLIPIKN